MTGEDAAIERLVAAERLPADYRDRALPVWRKLADLIAGWRAEIAGRGLILGVSGPQGSGKSTVSRFLAEALLPARGLSAAVVGLDDFYLGKAERARLAQTIHPLLATRGVPGTHEVARLRAALVALATTAGPISLPLFDKASDDRAGERQVSGPFDVVILEGWCVGAGAQTDVAEPINPLERDEDPDGLWREWVNQRLRDDYAALFATLDRLVYLQPPGWDAITAQRQRQEAKLRAATGGGMTEAQVDRFMAHYQRITQDMLRELPLRADLGVATDAQGNPFNQHA